MRLFYFWRDERPVDPAWQQTRPEVTEEVRGEVTEEVSGQEAAFGRCVKESCFWLLIKCINSGSRTTYTSLTIIFQF